MSASDFLPYGRQEIDADDIAAVSSVLNSDFLTQGPLVTKLEETFAATVGARHAVVCNSGTAALHLAMMALGIGPGDAVVVPSITFLATANAARFCGAEVVFADVDPLSGLITPETAAVACDRAGAHSVRAILCVHLNGWCADLAGLREVATIRRAALVEDACHAVGGHHTGLDGLPVPIGSCTLSNFTAFSLHPIKTITMGEGGLLTTNDEHLARIAARGRNHGMTREPAEFQNRDLAFDAASGVNPWYYEMLDLGWNYRATELQAALGLSQLTKLGRFAIRRRQLAARYDQALKPLAPKLMRISSQRGCTPCLHLYAVHIDFAAAGISRADLMRRLRERGIGTQVHYIPVHRQPYYARRYGQVDLPGAEAYYNSVLSLPFYPAMTSDDIDRVVNELGISLNA
jgi:UDP-4-amino-4,6-dideoxy-N-acetyl-beta-L-altrosamine transaminase